MENLHEEMIFEILLRLPVKSLLRFKCVSKSWFSLISSPYFAKLHFEQSSQHTHRILYTVSLQMKSLDNNASLHDDSTAVKLDFPFDDPFINADIMGSCRGFLLLSLIRDQILFVWNPSNGVFKQISLSFLGQFVFLFGFGYDESTDDYLIVLISFIPVPDLEVFSLRTNSWEKLSLDCPLIRRPSDPSAGSILNGAIHWLVRHLEQGATIIVLNIMTKNLQKEVPIPDDFNIHQFCKLGVLGGCLTLSNSNSDETMIWVMKEYGVKSSWTKLISLPRYRRDIYYISPLCYTKDGQLVVLDDDIGLSKWSDKGELLECREYCNHPYTSWGSGSLYTETLLSLP